MSRARKVSRNETEDIAAKSAPLQQQYPILTLCSMPCSMLTLCSMPCLLLQYRCRPRGSQDAPHPSSSLSKSELLP